MPVFSGASFLLPARRPVRERDRGPQSQAGHPPVFARVADEDGAGTQDEPKIPLSLGGDYEGLQRHRFGLNNDMLPGEVDLYFKSNIMDMVRDHNGLPRFYYLPSTFSLRIPSSSFLTSLAVPQRYMIAQSMPHTFYYIHRVRINPCYGVERRLDPEELTAVIQGEASPNDGARVLVMKLDRGQSRS